MQNKKYPIVIAGPTAIGKSQLAIDLAHEFSCEILSADSRQFYREISIGTAKPTEEEMQCIPHHFINNLSINEYFSVGDFEKEALKVGMQQRIWEGPPLATRVFGQPSEPGDFHGVGATGWKLLAYNHLQVDLLTRIHGYKLIRLSPYETIMTGGSLKRLDQLLINPKEEQRSMLFAWLMRKLG